MSSSNLALQGITRHQAGNYTCIASNVEGDGESPTYPLRVMCKKGGDVLRTSSRWLIFHHFFSFVLFPL